MFKMKGSQAYLPYGRQTIDESDICSVIKALKSPYLTQGPLVKLIFPRKSGHKEELVLA
jgi:hypothetical protein